MSDCCSVKGEVCERPQASRPGLCPQCGKKGKSVSTLTVKSLVRDHTRVSATASYAFCREPECDVVYFAEDHLFRKADLKVRVGLKEREDPIPLCYCFGYSRADVRREMEEHGRTEVLQRVKAEVEGGFCACEVKNPSGACCLGDITRAIQEMKVLAGQGA
jgi:CopZ-like zinc binding protein